jgi:peptide/nickel transport system permease protein
MIQAMVGAQEAAAVTARRPFRFACRLLGHPSAALGFVILCAFGVVALSANLVAPFDPNEAHLLDRLSPPTWLSHGGSGYLLGTDQLGRDIFSRILYGTRVSLLIGLLSVSISMIVGLALGTCAGFYRGWFDALVSRFADLLMAFPYLIFAIGMMAVIGPGFWNLVLALSFKGWVEFFRLVRGETLAQQCREYVEAARAMGASSGRIIGRHILPNIIHTSIVLATLRMGYFIVLEASLSYLGLGVPPRIPAWGSMVADGNEVLFSAWWVSTFPGLAIAALVLAVNLLGEGVREILDPRLRIG